MSVHPHGHARCLLLAACMAVGAGCAAPMAAGAGREPPPRAAQPTRTVGPPTQRTQQQRLLTALGAVLRQAIASDAIGEVLFDDIALRTLLSPQHASRAALLRHNALGRLTVDPVARRLFAHARFAGLCVQNARTERPGGPLGLVQPGWVFDRVLVIAAEAGGGRLASWVEGTFVHTDAGLGALVVERVEAPRREHADLQLAVCDLEVSIAATEPRVVGEP